MRAHPLGSLVLLAALASGTAQAADSFAGSCSRIRQSGPMLSALCEDGRGGSIQTSIDMRQCGQADVANVQGRLSCGSIQGSAQDASPPASGSQGPGALFGQSDAMSEANERCRQMGFAPGSQPMADCMSSAMDSQDAQRRRAERQDRDERFERDRRAAASQRETQDFFDKNRADADAWRNRPNQQPTIFNNQ